MGKAGRAIFVAGGLVLAAIAASKAAGDGNGEPDPGQPYHLVMPASMDVAISGNGQVMGMYWDVTFSLVISNPSSVPVTGQVRFYDNYNIRNFTKPITAPAFGEYRWSIITQVDFRQVPQYIMTAEGEWDGDNTSVGVARL
jgi:hypothetical protein